MNLRSTFGYVSVVTTVWNGQLILLAWNVKNQNIMFDHFDGAKLDEEDRIILTGLVKEFYEPLEREK